VKRVQGIHRQNQKSARMRLSISYTQPCIIDIDNHNSIEPYLQLLSIMKLHFLTVATLLLVGVATAETDEVSCVLIICAYDVFISI